MLASYGLAQIAYKEGRYDEARLHHERHLWANVHPGTPEALARLLPQVYEQLRRLARLGLMAGIRAIGDEAPRQRRRRAERIGRRKGEADSSSSPTS